MMATVHSTARLSLLLPILVTREANSFIGCGSEPGRLIVSGAIFGVKEVDSQAPLV